MKISLKAPGLSLYPGTGSHWWKHITSSQLIELAQAADELGYDYLTVSEHFVMNRGHAAQMGSRWVHSLSAAGVLLGATKRIKVVCLLVVPYHQPIELAKALATLEFMSGGRVVPMLMVGYNEWEFDLLNVPVGERGPRTDEYVEAMLELWTNPNPSYEGRFVRFDDIAFDPRPRSPLPLWFGGRTKAALRRIARHGDGWMSYATPRSEFPAMVEHIRTQPEFLARPRHLDLSLSMFEGRRHPITHEVIEQAQVSFDPDVIVKELRTIASLGANVVAADDVIGTGKFQNGRPDQPLPTRDFNHHLERMRWFAETLLPEAHTI